NFLLVDEGDKVIARSRSLAVLREQHAGASPQEYAKRSQLATGARTWEFGEIAAQQQVAAGRLRQGRDPALGDAGETDGEREFGEIAAQQQVAAGRVSQVGYPALVDEGETVGERVFATEAEAHASHLRGSVRLIRLALAREFKSLRRDLAVNVQGEHVYRGLA